MSKQNTTLQPLNRVYFGSTAVSMFSTVISRSEREYLRGLYKKNTLLCFRTVHNRNKRFHIVVSYYVVSRHRALGCIRRKLLNWKLFCIRHALSHAHQAQRVRTRSHDNKKNDSNSISGCISPLVS
jgi:hypothetical protein